MRLYEVLSLLLCSWKAEVYINKIYNTQALKETATIWKDVTPYFCKANKHICVIVQKDNKALECFVISVANQKPNVSGWEAIKLKNWSTKLHYNARRDLLPSCHKVQQLVLGVYLKGFGWYWSQNSAQINRSSVSHKFGRSLLSN